ncbi:MAG: T9SS type A sorting domain-containing protein [Bacteroidota bacterium]|nr:T9SS type A sorting domain-containing protein [Bacteroidota bacterium]
MKKTLSILFIAMFGSSYVFSQVPNSSFENWSGSEPNSWITSNFFILLGNPQSVFKTTDAHTGNYACEMRTIHVVTKPQNGQFLPDYTASAFLGKVSGFIPILGIPYTYRPTVFRFWYKYSPSTNDSAAAWVTLSKWNTTTNRRDTIGLCDSTLFTTASSYTQAEYSIRYLNAKIPDTLTILFSSSIYSTKQEGSKFIVDDVELVGGNTGISEGENYDVSVYPNPTSDYINVYSNNLTQPFHVSINDMQGNNVYSSVYKNMPNIAIPTAHFSKGIYIVKTTTEKGVSIHKIILQ